MEAMVLLSAPSPSSRCSPFWHVLAPVTLSHFTGWVQFRSGIEPVQVLSGESPVSRHPSSMKAILVLFFAACPSSVCSPF